MFNMIQAFFSHLRKFDWNSPNRLKKYFVIQSLENKKLTYLSFNHTGTTTLSLSTSISVQTCWEFNISRTNVFYGGLQCLKYAIWISSGRLKWIWAPRLFFVGAMLQNMVLKVTHQGANIFKVSKPRYQDQPSYRLPVLLRQKYTISTEEQMKPAHI